MNKDSRGTTGSVCSHPAGKVTMSPTECDFDHPHPDHPCGKRVIPGVTRCAYCGNLDDSPECDAAGCWEPVTEADIDALYAEAWGIPDPGQSDG